jgi:hypothetical protein
MASRRGPPSGGRVTAAIVGATQSMFHALPAEARPLIFLAMIAVLPMVGLAWKVDEISYNWLFVAAAAVVVVIAIILLVMTTAQRRAELRLSTLAQDLSLGITEGIEGILLNSSPREQAEAWAGLLISIEGISDNLTQTERGVREQMAKQIKKRIDAMADKYRRQGLDPQAYLNEISTIVEVRRKMRFD